MRLPAAALGDNGAAAGTDGEAFCVNLCERRGFLLRLPVHAAAYGDDAAAARAAGDGDTGFPLICCERRASPVRLEHALPLLVACCSGGACGHVTFLLL